MKEQNTKNKDFLSGPEILKEMNISTSNNDNGTATEDIKTSYKV